MNVARSEAGAVKTADSFSAKGQTMWGLRWPGDYFGESSA